MCTITEVLHSAGTGRTASTLIGTAGLRKHRLLELGRELLSHNRVGGVSSTEGRSQNLFVGVVVNSPVGALA